MFRNLLLLSALVSASLQAGEGLIVVQKHEDLRDGGASTQKMYVESDRVAVESTGDQRRMGFVYLADEGLIRIINHQNQTYREMTEQQLEQLVGGMQERMAEMRERMKDMSPQQRAMMEKMMGGRMARMQALQGAQAEPIEYRRGDGSTEIDGRSCDWYEGYRSEKLVSLVCAADWSAFDLEPGDFVVFQKLADFMSQLAPQMADRINFGSRDWEERKGFPGIPLEQKSFEGGRPVEQTTLESVERDQPIDAAVYEAPAGYQLQRGMR